MQFKRLPDPLPDMQAWGCRVGLYTFSITLELRNIKNFKGYTASWAMDGMPVQPIEGRWNKLVGAEVACQNVLRQLRAKQ